MGGLNDTNTDQEEWDDLLGTGTVLKKLIQAGDPKKEPEDDISMEAPRKFFALIDIETKCNGKQIHSESHKNYLLNVDADLFPGAHLVIPLMEIGERSRYLFDTKFCFGEQGLEPEVAPGAQLECEIHLKLRSAYDEFLEQMNCDERVQLAKRKKERGKFWYSRSNFQHAITIYQSIVDLCQEETSDQVLE